MNAKEFSEVIARAEEKILQHEMPAVIWAGWGTEEQSEMVIPVRRWIDGSGDDEVRGAMKYIRADTVPEPLTQEQRDLLELVELERWLNVNLMETWSFIIGRTRNGLVCGTNYKNMIPAGEFLALFRARLKPEKPALEEIIPKMRSCKTPDDIWDLWEDILNSWEAWQEWEAEHGE